MAETISAEQTVIGLRIEAEQKLRESKEAVKNSARRMSLMIGEAGTDSPLDFVYAATLGGESSDAGRSVELLEKIQALDAGNLVGVFDGESHILQTIGITEFEPLGLQCRQFRSSLGSGRFGFEYDPENRTFEASIALSSSVSRRNGTFYGYKPTIFSTDTMDTQVLFGTGEPHWHDKTPYFYRTKTIEIGSLAIIDTISSQDDLGRKMYAEYIEALARKVVGGSLSEFDTRHERGLIK